MLLADNPTNLTQNDFWKMIVEEKVGLVVCIVKNVLNMKYECAEYFPCEIWMESKTKTFGEILVALEKEEKPKGDEFMSTRELEVKDFTKNKVQKLQQITF